jgi:hypothetical protein
MSAGAGPASHVMVRIKVRVAADVGVPAIEAALVTALCVRAEPPMTAELVQIDVPVRRRTGGHTVAYAAVVQPLVETTPEDVALAARSAVRSVLRARFGESSRAKVRAVVDGDELTTCWRAISGAPARIYG